MTSKEQIAGIVLRAVQATGESTNNDMLRNATLETRLYGEKSGLDSLNLVNVIADVELGIFETFGRDVTLADDAAASEARSPFRRVGTLVDYVEARLAKPQ
jgi:acyl carrier protein